MVHSVCIYTIVVCAGYESKCSRNVHYMYKRTIHSFIECEFRFIVGTLNLVTKAWRCALFVIVEMYFFSFWDCTLCNSNRDKDNWAMDVKIAFATLRSSNNDCRQCTKSFISVQSSYCYLTVTIYKDIFQSNTGSNQCAIPKVNNHCSMSLKELSQTKPLDPP